MAFVAVGSNIDPERNVTAALISLTERTPVRSSSTFYRTEPIGSANQPKYINGLWLIETRLSPTAIRDALLRPIENELGRVRTEDRLAPRVLDLDLILYDDLVIDDGDIRLPHPDIVRPFVYVPVLELLEACDAADRDSIAKLLPAGLPPAAPGQALPGLTRRLRGLLSR